MKIAKVTKAAPSLSMQKYEKTTRAQVSTISSVSLWVSVVLHREEERCTGRMEDLELACEDLPLAMEVETVKVQLANLHTLKRGMLEALMQALQQGKQLLERLREIRTTGTLDSRPDNIRTSAEKGMCCFDEVGK